MRESTRWREKSTRRSPTPTESSFSLSPSAANNSAKPSGGAIDVAIDHDGVSSIDLTLGVTTFGTLVDGDSEHEWRIWEHDASK